MEQKSSFYLSILAVILAVGAVGFWIYKDITKVGVRRLNDNKPIDTESGGAKVEVLPTTAALPDAPMPDLSKPIKFYNNLGAEFERLMTDKIEASRRLLREDPTLFRSWMELASNYKNIEDFKSAEEAWYYAHLMIPDNAVALGNLANLYGYYLKDSARAEEYYMKAISVAGSMEYLFFQASDYYIQIRADRAKALEIVEQGIAKYPDSSDLKVLLDSIKSN
jgi:tetratricopeptide (TPR) repeat protein